MVQSDAKALLPAEVTSVDRPVADGARRAIQGLRSIDGFDLIHGLDVDLPFRTDCPTVSTVHDLSVFDTPWAFSSYRAAGERKLVARSIKRADEVIAVSAFTAERVADLFGRSAKVIPLAPPPNQVPANAEAIAGVRDRYELPDRFVLQLATIEPRKNVWLLADACAELGIPLVLAGGHDGRTPLPTSARYLGYVESAEVSPLIDAAEIVAYISHYEGFGLPPLEAMARKRPVVATAVGGLPDLAGGIELIPVDDRAALIMALKALWNDNERRLELARCGKTVARGMTWSANATETLEVYRKLGIPV